MSQTMLRFSLSELTHVRVACLQCGKGVIEAPVGRLDTVLDSGGCRLCRRDVIDLRNGPDPLDELRMAIERLSRLVADKKLTIEFEVAAPKT